MCDPVTIMAVTAAVSAGFTANQQIQQGKYQKGVSDYNAAVAKNQAQETQNQSIEQENKQRERTAQLLSKQRAQLGAANVDLSSGSALQLQQDTEMLGEVDAMRIRSNYDSQVAALNSQSSLLKNQGKFAQQSARTAAVGTLLQGTASVMGSGVSDKWFTPKSSAVSAKPTGL